MPTISMADTESWPVAQRTQLTKASSAKIFTARRPAPAANDDGLAAPAKAMTRASLAALPTMLEAKAAALARERPGSATSETSVDVFEIPESLKSPI